MYVLCAGCGRLIAEVEPGQVVVKHRGRVMRIAEGELVCACGTQTRIRAGVPVTEAATPSATVTIAALFD